MDPQGDHQDQHGQRDRERQAEIDHRPREPAGRTGTGSARCRPRSRRPCLRGLLPAPLAAAVNDIRCPVARADNAASSRDHRPAKLARVSPRARSRARPARDAGATARPRRRSVPEAVLDARVDVFGEEVELPADERSGEADDQRRSTTIFGTKVSVISWTWVSACSSAIATPTTIAAPTAGPAPTMTIQIADWMRSSASPSFIARSRRCRTASCLPLVSVAVARRRR